MSAEHAVARPGRSRGQGRTGRRRGGRNERDLEPEEVAEIVGVAATCQACGEELADCRGGRACRDACAAAALAKAGGVRG